MPERPAILLITPWYPNPRSAMEGSFIRDQAFCLSAQYAVEVLHLYKADIRCRAAFRPRLETLTDGPVVLHRLTGFHVNLPKAWPWMQVWSGIRTVRSLLRQKSYHAVHAHLLFPAGMIAAAAGIDPNTPILSTEHFGPFRELVRRRGRLIRLQRAVRRLDCLVAVSEFQKREVQAEFPEARIEVIPNPVDFELFRPGQPDADFTFLFCAGMGLPPTKGEVELLHAAETLWAAGESFRLEMIGDGSGRAALEALGQSRIREGRLYFTGMLPHTEVASRMARARALVHPSHGETQGMAVIEAAACGLPAIITPCGALAELADPTIGLTVPPRDPTALAAAMREMLHQADRFDPSLIRETRRRRFSFPVVAVQLSDLYQRLMIARRNPTD